MKAFRLASLCAVFMVLAGIVVSSHAQNVSVTITADNAYVFGFGDVNGITTLGSGIENCSAGDIFNCSAGPETYPITVPNFSAAYLYIAAWSDDQTSQGVIARFTDGSTVVLTGPSVPWEVYATGEQMDISPICFGDGCLPLSPPGPPDVPTLNGHIATGNSTNGWQDATAGFLVFGDDNTGTPGNPLFTDFPAVCGIEANARWMWRNPDPSTITDPFAIGQMTCSQSQSQEFLIFRVGPLNTVFPCMDVTDDSILCELGPSGLTGNYTYTFTVTNTSGVPAQYLLLPNAATSPHVVTFNPPLADGESRNVTVTLSGVSPQTSYCFDYTLADADVNECCSIQHCVDIVQDCNCLQLPNVTTGCVTGDPASFQITFNLTNLSDGPGEHLFLFPPPGSGATISPDYIDIPTLPVFGTTPTSYTITVSGVDTAPGFPFCIRFSIHDENLNECCSEVICFEVPDCLTFAMSPLLTAVPWGADTLLEWAPLVEAGGYDVVRGNLGVLRSNVGDYKAATEMCVASGMPGTSIVVPGSPVLGDGIWFLVRCATHAGETMSYNEGVASQVGSRDAGIALSPGVCP